jgi:hypothetical protein
MADTVYYKDLVDYTTKLGDYVDKLVSGNVVECPKIEEIKTDILKEGYKDVYKTLTSNKTSVSDYYKAVRTVQQMFKLDKCVDNAHNDKRQLFFKGF